MGGRLNFVKFETQQINECFEFVRQLKTEQEQSVNGSASPVQLCVMATGGGAYKYYDEMKRVLGVEVLREDEMECLIMGQCPPDVVCIAVLWTRQEKIRQVSISG